MYTSMPALFLSHGSPTILFDDDPAHRFLAQLGRQLPRPKSILMVSAHWETTVSQVSQASHPETIHDFGGFAPELYQIQYPAPGAPDLAVDVAARLRDAGVEVHIDPNRGLDHGAWVPLKLMYGDGDIPVTQLSIQPDLGPDHHLRVGQALAGLREHGVLVVGSGSLTHNLSEVFLGRMDHDRDIPGWVVEFTEWMAQALAEGRVDDILHYRERAQHAVENHPTEDHLLPLFVAMGAGGVQCTASRLHASYTFGVLAMDAYAFS